MSTLRGAAHAIMAQRDGGGLPTEAHWNALRAALAALPAEAAPSPSPSSAPRADDAFWLLDAFRNAMLTKANNCHLGATFQGGPLAGASIYNVYEKCAREVAAFMAECPVPAAAPASPQGERERALRLRDVLEKIACANFTRLIDAEAAAQDALIADDAASSPHYAEKGD